ncbi:MAG: CmcI family methyltransferase [Solirubrobacteraceae bacterium]
MTVRWKGVRGKLTRLAERETRPRRGAQGAEGAHPVACVPIEDRLKGQLRKYWFERHHQHSNDSYAGLLLRKFPEDLRIYEHLLWEDRPTVVIEIGTLRGASALWFRDRLRTLVAYGLIQDFRVITIDLEAELARPHLDRADPSWEESISLVSADICDESLPARIAEDVAPGARCLVIEDSAHVYDTTFAALKGFSRFVHPGGYLIVEDGYVDVESMRVKGHPRGVLPAVSDWLASPAGMDFSMRRDLELYGVTCFPKGVLQRREG